MRNVVIKGFVLVFFLLMSASASAHNTKPRVIKLEVNTSGALEMKSPSDCGTIMEPGCSKAPKGEALGFTFKLSGNVSNSACPSPAKYELSGIQLGGKNGLKPSVSEWDSPTKLLDDEVLADFKADPVTGWVFHKTETNGDITLQNNNGSKNGYWIWYRVRARCNNGSIATDIYYDPRIINEGND